MANIYDRNDRHYNRLARWFEQNSTIYRLKFGRIIKILYKPVMKQEFVPVQKAGFVLNPEKINFENPLDAYEYEVTFDWELETWLDYDKAVIPTNEWCWQLKSRLPRKLPKSVRRNPRAMAAYIGKSISRIQRKEKSSITNNKPKSGDE